MHYMNATTVKALGDELRRQAITQRMIEGADGERAGPIVGLRHRAGHALIEVGERMTQRAHAAGGGAAAHGAHEPRQAA